MKSFVLFNNKGGVGKTTLTFNIAHMLAELGHRVLAVDFDPQCNLSAMFVDEDELAELWDAPLSEGRTVAACIELVHRGRGTIRSPQLVESPSRPGLWLLPGHLSLSTFERELAVQWASVMATNNERSLDVTTALDVLTNEAAAVVGADYVILDVGPSLGAINRAALLAADHVVVPLAPDLFSLQGLRNVGPTLHEWRNNWSTVREHHLEGREQADLPPHDFTPIGYLLQQHLVRADRPVSAYTKWLDRVPREYRRHVLSAPGSKNKGGNIPPVDRDKHCIAMIKHYASLVPFAQRARKPMFDLRHADGISGSQYEAMRRCFEEFEQLSTNIIDRLT